MNRNPVPVGEVFVSPAGRPIFIDHKARVLELEPRAHLERRVPHPARGDLSPIPFVIYDYDEREAFDVDAEEANIIGTGETEAGAWRDAHLFLSEPEECTCAHAKP